MAARGWIAVLSPRTHTHTCACVCARWKGNTHANTWSLPFSLGCHRQTSILTHPALLPNPSHSLILPLLLDSSSRCQENTWYSLSLYVCVSVHVSVKAQSGVLQASIFSFVVFWKSVNSSVRGLLHHEFHPGKSAATKRQTGKEGDNGRKV